MNCRLFWLRSGKGLNTKRAASWPPFFACVNHLLFGVGYKYLFGAYAKVCFNAYNYIARIQVV